MCSCSKLNGSRYFRSWRGAIAQIFGGDGRNRQQIDWLWTNVIEQCLNDDKERLQSNETEKLEEKNRRFKCPYESFRTSTCTDWRLSSNFAATRWMTDIAATAIWTSKEPRCMSNRDRPRYSIRHDFKSWWVEPYYITQDRKECLDWLWWQLNVERIHYQWDYTYFEVSSVWTREKKVKLVETPKHMKNSRSTPR